jgi:WD40 repeat protein
MVSVLQREELDESYAHCLSFNFFGTRLALCFASGNIQVWDQLSSRWSPSYKWHSNHAGAIFKIRWAHPEFGSLLATCSFDKTVNIYEENPIEKSWKKISQLVESHEPIEDIQFAPAHLRLCLAVCSMNGEIRLYEPASALNYKLWNSSAPIVASPLGANVIAWNPSSQDPAMLLVGCNDSNKAREKFGRQVDEPAETLQLWGPVEEGKSWSKLFVPENGHEFSVVDISWAQLMGRSRHIVATADLNGVIHIWRLDSRGNMEIEDTVKDPLRTVYSIAWDLMGTTLSASCGDNILRMWKKKLQGGWEQQQEIRQK